MSKISRIARAVTGLRVQPCPASNPLTQIKMEVERGPFED